MNTYLVIKTIHILSACILLGTGLGIAFFMLRSWFSTNLNEKLYATRNTVLADYLFTLPAVIIQATSGLWLVWQAGYDWTATWLVMTYTLYAFIVLCWLPVVWIQIKLKKLIIKAIESNQSLPATYDKYFRIWFILGWPALISLVAILFLMILKPA